VRGLLEIDELAVGARRPAILESGKEKKKKEGTDNTRVTRFDPVAIDFAALTARITCLGPGDSGFLPRVSIDFASAGAGRVQEPKNG